MKEFVEKLIARLEEEKAKGFYDSDSVIGEKNVWAKSIEIVNKLAEEYNKEFAFVLSETETKELARIAREMRHMKVIPVTNNNGWIPCSERLPEEGKKVLTCTEDGWISVNINMPYNGRKNDFQCGYYVAWMPLPEPFKTKLIS